MPPCGKNLLTVMPQRVIFIQVRNAAQRRDSETGATASSTPKKTGKEDRK